MATSQRVLPSAPADGSCGLSRRHTSRPARCVCSATRFTQRFMSAQSYLLALARCRHHLDDGIGGARRLACLFVPLALHQIRTQ